MPYMTPRITLEAYEQELGSLMRLVSLDLDGDEELVQTVVFSPSREKLRMSPAELLRRGMWQEAYEAARENFVGLRQTQPEQLNKAPRMHKKKVAPRAR